EITPIQIEEARASGRLYIKDCDIEYLPQLPNEITSVTIENCNILKAMLAICGRLRSSAVTLLLLC
ncbi:type III secretion protein GogB, partial [Escherichia coli]